MADSLQITCQGCASLVTVRPKHFGKDIACPKCHKTISVPTVSDPAKREASSKTVTAAQLTLDSAPTLSRSLGHPISPTTLEWGRVALIAGTVLFLVLGAAKFLQADNPSYTTFAPGCVFGGCFVVFELLRYFLDELHLYTLSTGVATTAFFTSVVILLFAINEDDPGRQSVLSGFAGSLLGFATGIPFGQLMPQLTPKQPPHETKT